jgi:biopolymer transport protein ExbD
MSRITRKSAPNPDIPTASTGDIAFLLIIFFLVGTTFKASGGFKVVLPEAETTERILKRRNVENVWVDKQGRISVDDNIVMPASVTQLLAEKLIANPDIVVVLQADKDVPYGYVTDVLEALKDARALKVTFATGYRMGG